MVVLQSGVSWRWWLLGAHPLSGRTHENLPSNLPVKGIPFLLPVSDMIVIQFVLHQVQTKYYSGKKGKKMFSNFMRLWKISDIWSLA